MILNIRKSQRIRQPAHTLVDIGETSDAKISVKDIVTSRILLLNAGSGNSKSEDSFSLIKRNVVHAEIYVNLCVYAR